MHAKTSWVAVAAGLVGLAIPASASGATQIGQVAPAGPADCGLTVNTVQAATGGPPSYEVPAPGGVITSWSVVESATPGAARLQLWSGGGTSYVLEGRSNARDHGSRIEHVPDPNPGPGRSPARASGRFAAAVVRLYHGFGERRYSVRQHRLERCSPW